MLPIIPFDYCPSLYWKANYKCNEFRIKELNIEIYSGLFIDGRIQAVG